MAVGRHLPAAVPELNESILSGRYGWVPENVLVIRGIDAVQAARPHIAMAAAMASSSRPGRGGKAKK